MSNAVAMLLPPFCLGEFSSTRFSQLYIDLLCLSQYVGMNIEYMLASMWTDQLCDDGERSDS